MEDLASRLLPRLLARLHDLPGRVWLRLTSPSGMRLVAPILAAALVYLGWRLWRLAGRSPLGLVLRWWAVALGLAVFAAGVLYGVAAAPADLEAKVALRETAGDLPSLGRVALPDSLALAGAVAVSAAGVFVAWRWRAARLDPAESSLRAAAWRDLRRRARLPLAVVAVGLVGGAALVGAAVAAAASAPPQIPDVPGSPGAPGASGTAGSPGATPRGADGVTLWVGTSAGLNRLVPGAAGPRWETFVRPRAPLPANHVTALVAGAGGEVWVATHGGLARYREAGGQAEWRTATVESAGLPYPTVLGLAVDARGVAWAATGAGGAMVDLEAIAARRGGSRAFTGVNAPLMHQIMDAVYVDPAGQIWFGSAGGVNVYRPGAGDEPGTWPTGFNQSTTSGALPDNQVYAILGDRRGRIWFGTARGVAALTPAPDDFGLGAYDAPRWLTFAGQATPLSGESVHAIAEDGQGRLYFGTNSGVAVLDESEPDPGRRWRRLGAAPADGLPDPRVQALAVGPDGRLWAGTRGGLAVFDPARPQAGWRAYRAHPVRRWTGYLWPAHWQGQILADDVTALAFAR